MQLCLLCGQDDLIHADLPRVVAVLDVLCNAAVKQNGLLGDDADLGAEVGHVDVLGVVAINQLRGEMDLMSGDGNVIISDWKRNQSNERLYHYRYCDLSSNRVEVSLLFEISHAVRSFQTFLQLDEGHSRSFIVHLAQSSRKNDSVVEEPLSPRAVNVQFKSCSCGAAEFLKDQS